MVKLLFCNWVFFFQTNVNEFHLKSTRRFSFVYNSVKNLLLLIQNFVKLWVKDDRYLKFLFFWRKSDSTFNPGKLHADNVIIWISVCVKDLEYKQLSPNMASKLENVPCCIKYYWGLCEQNNTVNKCRWLDNRVNDHC